MEWAIERYKECLRVCKGLVAWVVEGKTENYCWSAAPLKLAVMIREAGFTLRKPPIYHRQGIPGSGGPDWLRNDYEFVICANKRGRLPWSENTAMGSVPKYKSPRTATNRGKDGVRKTAVYYDPEVSNPGNVITGTVGKGHLGWDDAHENEAPYPQWLVEMFVKSFCPPTGIVLDPFCGSGTTLAESLRLGRRAIGIDVRASQIELSKIRTQGLSVKEALAGQSLLFALNGTRQG